MVLLPKSAQSKKWQRTSKADSGLVLSEFLATTAGQKNVISCHFFLLDRVFSSGPLSFARRSHNL
jgi:hypothetical protein